MAKTGISFSSFNRLRKCIIAALLQSAQKLPKPTFHNPNLSFKFSLNLGTFYPLQISTDLYARRFGGSRA